MSQDTIGVVLDAGSQWTKAGFSGDSFPRCIIPTAVGRFRDNTLVDAVKDYYFGKEAIRHRGLCNMTWPIKDGVINDWSEMEMLWHHIFYREIHVAPENAKVMIAIHPLTPKKDKERISEIMFETFTVSDLYLASSPALVTYASGRTTAVVWECGDLCSYVSPIFEGFPLKNATIRSSINGRVLTEYMQNLLSKVGYSFMTPVEMEILDKAKADLCYVADDYENEMKEALAVKEKVQYDLPDGQHIIVGEERFKCPELLFQPSLQDLECPSIVDIICSSISMCEIDYKTTFYNNVILSGGGTMFSGLSKRLEFELRKRIIDVPELKVFVDALPSRNVVPWVGGSILASMDSSNGFWLNRDEYEDGGSNRVHYKFI